jgi:hypothetical protein
MRTQQARQLLLPLLFVSRLPGMGNRSFTIPLDELTVTTFAGSRNFCMRNGHATESYNTSPILVISDFECDALVFEAAKPTTVAPLLLPDSAKATRRARVHLTASRAATRRNNDTQGTGNHATAAHAEASVSTAREPVRAAHPA